MADIADLVGWWRCVAQWPLGQEHGVRPPSQTWSTYRLQLHEGFDLTAAAGVIDHLRALGVTHLYSSPLLQAAPGSTHGYDVVDPSRVNEELGGRPALDALVEQLHAADLGLVLDIVPNHMATAADNPYWWDVLKHGRGSAFAHFFDIDWTEGTVLVPVLGDHYGRVLEAGELVVVRTADDLELTYHEHRLPLSPETVREVIAAVGAGSVQGADAELLHAIDEEVAALNKDVDRLDDLLSRQHYRLAWWRTGGDELDYRRFFNIETLAGLRVEDPSVFDATHALVVELVREGAVDALRVDHVDGLRDPAGYLQRLAAATGGVVTVVEKILEPGEQLPDWPVAGTSGYDFLTRANNVLVRCAGEEAMTRAYAECTGETETYDDVLHDAKLRVLRHELYPEVARLTDLLGQRFHADRRHRDHTRRVLRDALCEVIAQFPVYRSYVTETSITLDDRAHVAQAVARAREARTDLDDELLQKLVEVLLEPSELSARFQQLTSPAMAKGAEDTAFYRYHRLISLNEVGGDPGRFGCTVEEFHRDTTTMEEHWPHTMLTLSTHDTKRSADVRARLAVLAELPEAFAAFCQQWLEDGDVDRNAQWLLLQTLVGAWPIEVGRVEAFMAKATREAKVRTSWAEPDPAYDDAVARLVRRLHGDPAFVRSLESFLSEHQVVARGRRNALAQTALLLTCPGIADIYQGTEVEDRSLVDPDNRRPVDFDLRRRLLADGSDDKLRLVVAALRARRSASAAYAPLEATGRGADRVLGFSRGDLLCVVPLGGPDLPEATLDLPEGEWTDAVTGATRSGRSSTTELWGGFPVAVLTR